MTPYFIKSTILDNHNLVCRFQAKNLKLHYPLVKFNYKKNLIFCKNNQTVGDTNKNVNTNNKFILSKIISIYPEVSKEVLLIIINQIEIFLKYGFVVHENDLTNRVLQANIACNIDTYFVHKICCAINSIIQSNGSLAVKDLAMFLNI